MSSEESRWGVERGSRYVARERRVAPALCPLSETCEMLRRDREEYQRLTRRYKAEGSQVFYLEYEDPEMRKKKVKGRSPRAQQRMNEMCPQFQVRVLGMIPVTNPPYLDCTKFSEWYWRTHER